MKPRMFSHVNTNKIPLHLNENVVLTSNGTIQRKHSRRRKSTSDHSKRAVVAGGETSSSLSSLSRNRLTLFLLFVMVTGIAVYFTTSFLVDYLIRSDNYLNRNPRNTLPPRTITENLWKESKSIRSEKTFEIVEHKEDTSTTIAIEKSPEVDVEVPDDLLANSSSRSTGKDDERKKADNSQEQQQEQQQVPKDDHGVVVSSSSSYQMINNHKKNKVKYIKLDPLLSEVFVPEDQRICLVHIGKTAGSTIACLLGFDYDCDQETPVATASQLVRRTTRIRHSHEDDCLLDDHSNQLFFDYYLFTTRHPLKRMQSWFTYERPGSGLLASPQSFFRKAKLYLECPFRTFNDLGEIGLANIDNPKNETLCQTRAWMAVTGKVGYSRHNLMNYQWYYNKLGNDDDSNTDSPKKKKKKKILVIRTEHLKEDWLNIETRIFQSDASKIHIDIPKHNTSPKKKEDTELSDQAIRNICKALCHEIQMYKFILNQAENLTPQEVQISLQELAVECPHEVKMETCER